MHRQEKKKKKKCWGKWSEQMETGKKVVTTPCEGSDVKWCSHGRYRVVSIHFDICGGSTTLPLSSRSGYHQAVGTKLSGALREQRAHPSGLPLLQGLSLHFWTITSDRSFKNTTTKLRHCIPTLSFLTSKVPPLHWSLLKGGVTCWIPGANDTELTFGSSEISNVHTPLCT